MVKVLYIYLFIVLSTVILYFAKPLLMPLALAGVLALVFMPLCQWLESKGWGRIWAALACGVIFSLLVVGIIAFISWRVEQIASDFSSIRQNIGGYLEGCRKYLHDRLGVDVLKKSGLLAMPAQPDSAGVGRMATSIIGWLMSLAINLILVLVYMIMLLGIRREIKLFILKLVSNDERGKAEIVVGRSVAIVQQYLLGLAVVIVCLWIMYTIGFSLVGVRNALFFAILCGLLEIIPFVGNITGSTLTSIMALSQGGGIKMVLGVLVTYALIQFIQFYIISPLVMRRQVSIYPLFTILVLIAGDLVWGIPGMIVAIPALGILKIVCDNIEPLQAFGALLGRSRDKPVRLWRQR